MIGRVTKLDLGLTDSASFFNLMLCVALHVPTHRLDKQHHSLHKGQRNFGFQFAEMEVWHSLAVVLDDDVTWLAWMMNDLPKRLESYVTGQIFSRNLRGVMVATPLCSATTV